MDTSRPENMDQAVADVKKTYHAPALTEWGRLEDVTRGQQGGEADGNFTGSIPNLL
jgi:hypothetical protein